MTKAEKFQSAIEAEDKRRGIDPRSSRSLSAKARLFRAVHSHLGFQTPESCEAYFDARAQAKKVMN